jgi:hypothetical protein
VSTRRALRSALLVLAAGGCTGYAGGPRGSGPFLGAAREDRVTVTAMSAIQAVAISRRYVYVATPTALGVFDRQFDRWLPPVTRRDGWPGGALSIFAGDPNDDALWFATAAGLYQYRAVLNDLQRSSLADTPRQLFFDRGDPSAGVFVLGSMQNWRISSTGMSQVVSARELPPPVRRVYPQTLNDLYARYPAVRDFERLLTQDAELRSFPVTSGAASLEQSELWLGTAGGGVYKVDPLFTRSEARPFGLLEPGAGAIAATSDGVWIAGAGDRVTFREGITFGSHDLSRWRWLDGGALGPLLGGRTLSIAPWESSLWVGGERGLQRVDATSGRGDRRIGVEDGLPSDIVLAVLPRPGGVWAGTARGLAFVSDQGEGALRYQVQPAVLDNSPVRALARRGDTLWIGTELGVAVLLPNEPRPRRVRIAETSPRFAQPISALAIADSVLAMGTTRGEVLLLHTADGRELPPPVVDVGRGGGIVGLAMDATSMWIAAPNGVTVIERASGLGRYLSAGADLPGDVTGVALSRDYAWVATRDGVVRFRRMADGAIR